MPIINYQARQFSLGVLILFFAAQAGSLAQNDESPTSLKALIEAHCIDCHDDVQAEGGLDFLSLKWNLADPHAAGRWVKVHDQLASGKMPPKKKSKVKDAERQAAVKDLARAITLAQENESAETWPLGFPSGQSL